MAFGLILAAVGAGTAVKVGGLKSLASALRDTFGVDEVSWRSTGPAFCRAAA